MEQKTVHISRSSIGGLPTNIVSALCYVIPAAVSWIPLVGYFAWIIPMAAFLSEHRSNFVRFCGAQSFCLGLARLVFAVVFDGIKNVALSTYAVYGKSADYINFWGNTAGTGASVVLGLIFAIALCVIAAVCSVMALNKKLWRLPFLGSVSEFMTMELRPKSRHNTFTR